jgi:hypothetical protein
VANLLHLRFEFAGLGSGYNLVRRNLHTMSGQSKKSHENQKPRILQTQNAAKAA